MQTSERHRLMEAYRDEIAGRVALGAKCAVGALVIAVLVLAANGTRNGGAPETSTHAAAASNDGDAHDKKSVVDEQQALSLSPVFAP